MPVGSFEHQIQEAQVAGIFKYLDDIIIIRTTIHPSKAAGFSISPIAGLTHDALGFMHTGWSIEFGQEFPQAHRIFTRTDSVDRALNWCMIVPCSSQMVLSSYSRQRIMTGPIGRRSACGATSMPAMD